MITTMILSLAVTTELPNIENDKLLHGLGSASLQAVCEHFAAKADMDPLPRTLTCLAAVNGLGLIKETIDPMRGGKREVGDVLSNAIGSSLM